MNSVLSIRMTLSCKGFSLSSSSYPLLRVLDNGILEIQLNADYTQFVVPVQKRSNFSIELTEGLIMYVLEYYTNTDSEEERSYQRAVLLNKVKDIHDQTERAIFLCPEKKSESEELLKG